MIYIRSIHIIRRDEDKMAVSDYQSLIEFLESIKYTCGYELIVLFAAIKLKDAEGRFDRERLTDFFIDFYKIGEANNLTLEQECNPLQIEDLNETMQMINRNPIGSLLSTGILSTFERFNKHIFKIIFDNEEEILSKISDQIINFFSETFRNSRQTMEAIISEWETSTNESIRKNALQNVAGSIENINLESILKYLYQSFSQEAYNKLLNNFQITEQEFDDYFIKKPEHFLKYFQEQEKEAEVPAPEKAAEATKFSPQRIQQLTNFFQKIREEEEEEAKGKSKKTKKR